MSAEMKARARALRKNPTPAEAELWEHLRARKTGYHWRRQQVIHGFIVDFCCDALRLVVEVDGSVHDQTAEADAERDRQLEAMGFQVLRFTNDEVLNDTGLVLRKIGLHSRGMNRTPPLPVRGGAGGWGERE